MPMSVVVSKAFSIFGTRGSFRCSNLDLYDEVDIDDVTGECGGPAV